MTDEEIVKLISKGFSLLNLLFIEFASLHPSEFQAFIDEKIEKFNSEKID